MVWEPLLLLGLGLCLSTRIQASYFSGPGPEIRMRPNNIRPLGSHVIISCYTPYKADYFRLIIVYFNLWGAISEDYPAIYPGHECHLYHPALRVEHGSRYQCLYRTGPTWSRPSPQMDLIISDVFPAPVMITSAPMVKAGGTVKFFCKASMPVQNWMLIKGRVDMSNYVLEHRGQDFNFTLEDVKESNAGEYRCFAYNRSTLHIWTASSNPVSVYLDMGGDGSGSIGGGTASNTSGILPSSGSPGISVSSTLLALLPLQSQWA